MIIGTGLMAKAFAGDFAAMRDILIFASGVSNSQETNAEAFIREKALLESVLQFQGRIVYFSTCSIYDRSLHNSPYVSHKREMEALVRQSREHTIFRLPQVVGKTANPKTLTNYLYAKIMGHEHFDVWRHARRNIIDVSDVEVIAKAFLNAERDRNETVNIASPSSLPILELVTIFEKVLNRKAYYSLVEAGGSCRIEAGRAREFAELAGIKFDDGYSERVIRKYYGS